VDIHIAKRKIVAKALTGLNVKSENKKKLKSSNLGVLVAFNIVDLAIHYYKAKNILEK